MSLASKVIQLKEKIKNNISAVKERHVYSGNKVDVSEDILNIRSVPVGQVITGMRRPTTLSQTGGGFTIPTNNTILGTGDNVVTYANNIFNMPVKVGGEEIAKLPSAAAGWFPCTIVYTIKSPIATSIQLGDNSLCMVASGFSYADFVPKNNAVMEIYVKVKFTSRDAEFHNIYVRYINP